MRDGKFLTWKKEMRLPACMIGNARGMTNRRVCVTQMACELSVIKGFLPVGMLNQSCGTR